MQTSPADRPVKSEPDRVDNMDASLGPGCTLLALVAVLLAIALTLMLVRAYSQSIQKPLPILPRAPELPPFHEY